MHPSRSWRLAAASRRHAVVSSPRPSLSFGAGGNVGGTLTGCRSCGRPLPFSSSSSFCPFRALGIDKRGRGVIAYEEVRAAYRKLALLHHPDTRATTTTEGRETNPSSSETEDFVRIRRAFESIAKSPDGEAVLRSGRDQYDEGGGGGGDESKGRGGTASANTRPQRHDDDDYHGNGFLHRSVDPRVLRELAHVAETMNPGGLHKGGLWEYARVVKNMQDNGGLPPLRVDGGGGEGEGGGGDGKKTRRRRRRRK